MSRAHGDPSAGMGMLKGVPGFSSSCVGWSSALKAGHGSPSPGTGGWGGRRSVRPSNPSCEPGLVPSAQPACVAQRPPPQLGAAPELGAWRLLPPTMSPLLMPVPTGEAEPVPAGRDRGLPWRWSPSPLPGRDSPGWGQGTRLFAVIAGSSRQQSRKPSVPPATASPTGHRARRLR